MNFSLVHFVKENGNNNGFHGTAYKNGIRYYGNKSGSAFLGLSSGGKACRMVVQ